MKLLQPTAGKEKKKEKKWKPQCQTEFGFQTLTAEIPLSPWGKAIKNTSKCVSCPYSSAHFTENQGPSKFSRLPKAGQELQE